MTRLMLLSVVALGIAACGGAEDDTWNVELADPAGEVGFDDSLIEDATPAQRLLLLLTGGVEAVGTEVGPDIHAGDSSPDPMPGKQKEGGGSELGDPNTSRTRSR